MEFNKRYEIKNIMLAALWVVLGGATVFLLIAAIKSKPAEQCKGIEINIHGVSNNFFVDKNDILRSITASEKKTPAGKAIGSFDLGKMEKELKTDVWIKSAELFFDNNEILQVIVHEREPIARVFSAAGTSFYIDNELAILPLSEKFSARLPMFTNFPSDKKVLSVVDSLLLQDIKTVSLAIQNDSFSMAMIEQVDITSQRLFEMVPKIGNQLIIFGDASDAKKKLDKLKTFYKEIIVKAGWDNYSVINVQYKNQVVAKRKGAEDVAADSLRAKQILQMIAERAQRNAEDSLITIKPDNDRNTVDSTMIQQSIQRDDMFESPGIEKLSVLEPGQTGAGGPDKNKMPELKKELKTIVKPVKKDTQQPKAVMQKKNDYTPIP